MTTDWSEAACAAPRMTRRMVLAQLVLALTAGCGAGRRRAVQSDPRIARLRRLEEVAGGRLGAYIYDTDTRTGIGWRENERFAHCSSFKLSLAAMILRMGEQGQADLAEVLRWERRDLMSVSPATEANLERGLSVEALARATLITSDNTAANVLMKRFGGPTSLTGFWRGIGDSVSRLDRYEPALNDVPPGSDMDTTTPKAMAMTTSAIVSGTVLSAANTAKIKGWMSEVRTGSERIRAGFPPEWEAGDKTGTGIGKTKNTYVDLAYGGPRGRQPIIVAAYFEPARRVDPMDPVALKALADVGRIASGQL
jgi:beta-lactamase class A